MGGVNINKEKFEDYKKAIELTRGRKTVVTPEVADFFEKYFRPLQTQIMKISQKKPRAALALTSTTILRLLDPMTKEGRSVILDSINVRSEHFDYVKKEAKLTLDLYKRLRSERKQKKKESKKIGDI